MKNTKFPSKKPDHANTNKASMDHDQNHHKYIINMKLMKMTGFYQLINPNTPRYFGYNPFKVMATIEIIFGVSAISVLIVSTFYFLHNTNELMKHIMLAASLIFSTFKVFCVSRNSKLIWNCMNVTSVDFLSYNGHRRDKPLQSARSKSILISVMFLLLYGSAAVAWSLSPFFLKTVYLDMEIKHEVRHYRYNTMNVYPVAEQFYNNNFVPFYIVETLQCIIWIHGSIMYDTFVISMCIAIGFQLKTIATSYSELCYDLNGDHANRDSTVELSNSGKDNTGNIKERKPEATLNLKLLIHDQQHLLKIIREIFKFFEPVTFVQIAAQSMLIIIQVYMIFINHYNGLPLISVPNIRLVLTVTPYIIHLYITCYLFGHINDQKESMNFSLYCSDWTKMSIKYKKLLLFTMRMNSAENLKLKISLKKVINLEMFSSVMHTTYSVISVLAKSYGSTN